jgi:hypothetical protein
MNEARLCWITVDGIINNKMLFSIVCSMDEFRRISSFN